MNDREFTFATYAQNPRPYRPAEQALSQRLRPLLKRLIEESQRAWLHSDFAFAQSGRRPSNSIACYFTDFFAHFETELRAHIYDLASNGTIITRELIESLLAGPLPQTTSRILDRMQSFPDDYLNRTCDLGHGCTKPHEMNDVPALSDARFAIVADTGLYMAHYDVKYPGIKHTQSGREYVVLRDDSLKWLDLSDDTGEFADLNFVYVQ